jgi:hypothetical protein
MNRFMLVVISAFVLVLSACGGGSSNPNPNPNPNPKPDPDNALAGSYLGEVQVEVGSSGPVFYTSTASFTISNTGELTGKVTAKDPSDVPAGEEGTITGTVKIDNVTGNAGFVSIDMTVESPTLGKYTLTGGIGQYGTVAGKLQVGVSGFTVKDASGTFLGTGGTILGSKQ